MQACVAQVISVHVQEQPVAPFLMNRTAANLRGQTGDCVGKIGIHYQFNVRRSTGLADRRIIGRAKIHHRPLDGLAPKIIEPNRIVRSIEPP